MPSFDIVSRTDLAEVENALNNMRREIDQRYDFKGSNCSIERNEASLTIKADDDLKLNQMHELLKGHLTRRKIDAEVLDFKTPESAAGTSVRQTVEVRQGIQQELGKRIVEAVKDRKMKVQIAIQGDELRVSGKKRDDLQAAMGVAKALDLGMPLQFVNFRD